MLHATEKSIFRFFVRRFIWLDAIFLESTTHFISSMHIKCVCKWVWKIAREVRSMVNPKRSAHTPYSKNAQFVYVFVYMPCQAMPCSTSFSHIDPYVEQKAEKHWKEAKWASERLKDRREWMQISVVAAAAAVCVDFGSLKNWQAFIQIHSFR